MSVPAKKIAEVLGGYRILGRSVRNLHDLDTIIAALASDTSGVDLSVQIRNKIVPRATYQRVDRLNLQVGETTERLARLYSLALSVFEGREAAARFLMTPHPELGGRAPFDAALTEIGGREVEEVIERGRHGLPA